MSINIYLINNIILIYNIFKKLVKKYLFIY